MKVEYCKHSDTLRQMPQNYLIAFKKGKEWVVDPDMAMNVNLAVYAFKIISFIHRIKYNARGEYIANLLNKKIEKGLL